MSQIQLELYTTEAKLISAKSEDSFNTEVNKYIKKGWTIHGHMIIVPGTSGGMFNILMIKVNPGLKEVARIALESISSQFPTV